MRQSISENAPEEAEMKTKEDWGKLFRYAGPSIFLLPLALFMLVFGIVSVANPLSGYRETEGRVREVVIHEKDEQIPYEVFFSFEADGKTYDGSFTFGPYDYRPGDPVKVYYDPRDPSVTSPRVGNPFWGWAVLGLSLLMGLYGAFAVRKAYHKVQEDQKTEEPSKDWKEEA